MGLRMMRSYLRIKSVPVNPQPKRNELLNDHLQFERLAEILGLRDLPLDILVPQFVGAPLAPAGVHGALVLCPHVLLVVRVLCVDVVLQVSIELWPSSG